MIDKSIVEQARNIDIVAFLERYNGFTFAHRSGVYRCKQHPSLAVKNDRLSFYWHSKGIGGFGALDYLVKVENMPFREAVEAVTGIDTTTAPPTQAEAPKPKTLILPEKAGIPLRLYDYLCRKRGIDGDIVNRLMQKEMLYEDRRGNVVFVGYDEANKPRFASLRGIYGDCTFRGDCAGSDKRYGFNTAADGTGTPSDRLYIFESPIDLMSHASLEKAHTGAWEQHSRLSLSGTSDTALSFFLNQHKAVKELVFCLDNDQAGREATAIMARKYAAKGYTVLVDFPKSKDFNEDLTAHLAEQMSIKRTKTLHRDVDICQ